jgi:hypothetical protein
VFPTVVLSGAVRFFFGGCLHWSLFIIFTNPEYKTVCSGATDHAEAVKIEFDPGIVLYADLVGVFALFSGLWLLILERAVEFFLSHA